MSASYRRLLLVVAICAAVTGLMITGLRPSVAEEKEAEFVSLFNGKDLTGWVGDPRLWEVEDGEIAGTTSADIKLEHNTFLATEKEYGDFVFRAKVKLINHNSGIQFRSKQHPDYVVRGYQADMAEQTYFGMLYEEGGRGIMEYFKALPEEEKKANHEAAKQGEWNQYEITCKGDHVTIVLNGRTTCDIVDPEGAKKGVFAFQLHAGPPMEVRFKDIEVKALDTKPMR